MYVVTACFEMGDLHGGNVALVRTSFEQEPFAVVIKVFDFAYFPGREVVGVVEPSDMDLGFRVCLLNLVEQFSEGVYIC